MQLKMPFLEVAEPSPSMPTAGSAPTSPPPTAWDQLDEAARIAAFEKLATLIARMLVVLPATTPRTLEPNHE